MVARPQAKGKYMELSTKLPLHPKQVADLNGIKAQIHAQMNAAPHIRAPLDMGDMADQLRETDEVLQQAAQPFSSEEIDDAVKVEQALRTRWMEGMPTQAEMRKNPPGAVDKHRKWEAAQKDNVLRWKGHCRRLHASGIADGRLDDAGDISNVEMFRPVGGSGEMNMDNAQIPGTAYHLPPSGAAPGVIFTEDEKTALEAIDPELRDMLVTADNAMRHKIKTILRGIPESGHNSADKGAEKKRLYAQAKELGINSFGMSMMKLREAIAAAA